MGAVSAKNRRGFCVYCGRMAKLTKDHIPPRCLFPTVPETKLIKVPACAFCNASASKDDEYFRLNVALRDDVAHEPDVQAVLPAILRSLQRKEASGFSDAFFRGMHYVEATSPAGIILGKRAAYNVDLDRLARIPTRIVQGLFWRHCRRRVPSDYRVITYALAGFHDAPLALDKIRANIVGPLLSGEPVSIGRAFSYWFKFVDDDSNASAWLMRFYQRVIFLSAILPSE